MSTSVNTTSRRVKSISFDMTDTHEAALLEHAEKSGKNKFSRYIKRLIADDMNGSNRVLAGREIVPDETEKDDNVKAMTNFL